MQFSYTLLLESPRKRSRAECWQLLWQLVVAPERWREGVTACQILNCDEGSCRLTRRVWFAQQAFVETVTWVPHVQFRVDTHPVADFPGGSLTVALDEGPEWLVTFTYERAGPDLLLPDGSHLRDWLAAAYRQADEALIERLRAAALGDGG